MSHESPGPLTPRESGLGPLHMQGRPRRSSRGPSSRGILFQGFASLLEVNAHPLSHACCPGPKPCGRQALSRFSLINRSHPCPLLQLVGAFGVWEGSKLCKQLWRFPVTKSFGQRTSVNSGASLLSPSCQPRPSSPPRSSEPHPPDLEGSTLSSVEQGSSASPGTLTPPCRLTILLGTFPSVGREFGFWMVTNIRHRCAREREGLCGPKSAPQKAVMTTRRNIQFPRTCRFV